MNGVNGVNRIDVLDLDQVALNIVELYESERGRDDISLNVVRDLLDEWAVKKYPIFKKFGNKLMVETEQRIDSEVGVLDSFLEICEGSSEKHFQKSHNTSSALELSKLLESMAGRILASFTKLSKVEMMHVIENKAFSESRQLERFIEQLISYVPVQVSVEVMAKALKQSKLTKQFAIMVTGTGGLCSIPDWYSEEDKELRQAEHSRYISVLPERFSTCLSEVKQNIVVEETTTKFVMSIDPYDYVTMSYNGLGWKSCVHPSGDYAEATFSALIDSSTIISYIPSEKFESNGLKAFVNNKKFRAMVHLSCNLESLMINKVYPSNLMSYPFVVESAMNEMNFFNQNVKLCKNLPYDLEFSSQMYDDSQQISMSFITDFETAELCEKDLACLYFEVGGEVPCMSCGKYGDSSSDESWMCDTCRYGENYHSCVYCGDLFSDYDAEEYEDSLHCPSCINSGVTSSGDNRCDCDSCAQRREEEEEDEDAPLVFATTVESEWTTVIIANRVQISSESTLKEVSNAYTYCSS